MEEQVYNMELRQLEAFVRVVELQSFSKAAKVLYLTQPTISVHISELEKELQTKLLDRTTKVVSTTKAGDTLYGYAKEILAIREEILNEFGTSFKEDIRLEIAGSTIPSRYILPELISVFRKKYKDVSFSLNQGDSRLVIEQILHHKADIGFVGMKSDDERLEYISFYKDKLAIITPNDEHYRNLLENNVTLLELMREPVILRENGSGTKKMAEKFLEKKGIRFKNLNVIAQINDQEIIKRSVEQGLGISIISEKAAMDYAKEGRILIHIPEKEQFIRDLYIVVEKRNKLIPLAKKFIEFCTHYYNLSL